MNTWENKPGNPVPDWLQGRGSGEAGKVLHIFDDRGILRRVEPEEVIKRAEIENQK